LLRRVAVIGWAVSAVPVGLNGPLCLEDFLGGLERAR